MKPKARSADRYERVRPNNGTLHRLQALNDEAERAGVLILNEAVWKYLEVWLAA